MFSEFVSVKCRLRHLRRKEEADLLCASGRLVGGVEVDDDGLALELVQRHGLPVLVLEGEVWWHAALADLQPNHDYQINQSQPKNHFRGGYGYEATYLAADDARGRRRAAPARRGRRGPEAAERGGGGRAEERRRLRAGRRRPRRQRQGRLAAGRSGRECHGGRSFR